MIDATNETKIGHKASSKLLCTPPAFTTSACHGVGHHVCYETFSSSNMESHRMLSVRYFTTVFQQIKHTVDDSFVFQQNSTLAHHACNIVQLLEHETLKYTSFANSPEVKLISKAYISMSISRETTRLKKSSNDWLVSQSRIQHSNEEKMLCSCYCVLQGNAEAVIRWGGKKYRHLMTYFLLNVFARNY